MVAIGRLATTTGCSVDCHRTTDFDAGLGAGNIDKAGAIRAARFHLRMCIRLSDERPRRRRLRARIGERLRPGAIVRDGERGCRREHGGAERQIASHGGYNTIFSVLVK